MKTAPFVLALTAAITACDRSSAVRAQPRSPTQFKVAIVGDDVPSNRPAADRIGDVNKAEGQDLWDGASAAFNARLARLGAYSDRLKLSYEGRDDGGQPDEAIKCAANLAQQPSVLAVVGHLSSGLTLQTASTYAIGGIPVLIPTGSSQCLNRIHLEEISGRPIVNTFRLIPRDSESQSPALVYFLTSVIHASSCVVMTDESAQAKDYSVPLRDHLLRALSKKRITVYPISARQERTDSSMVDEVIANDVDAVVYIGYASNFEPLLRTLSLAYPTVTSPPAGAPVRRPVLIATDACLDVGLKLPTMPVSFCYPVSLRRANAAAEAAGFDPATLHLGTRNLADFVYGFDGMSIVLDCVEHLLGAGLEVSRESVRSAIESGTFNGLGGEYHFVAGEDANSGYAIYSFGVPGELSLDAATETWLDSDMLGSTAR